MNKAEIIRLQSENDNLLSVMQYAYDEPIFLQYNIGFIKACFEEWYSCKILIDEHKIIIFH